MSNPKFQMGYMPVEHEYKLKCNFCECAAGLGLAGNGHCFLQGEWWNEECEQFISEEEFLQREDD